jgi:DNA-binding transcriptional LysR family regulator
LSRVAEGQSLSLDGPICITASEVVAAYFLPPIVKALRARYPGIDVEVVASNAVQDLRRREADIAIRSFRPTEPELVARKVRDGEAHLYATPGYLRTLGPKVTREALARATFIGFDHGPALRAGLSAALGVELSAERFAIVSASQHVQWALAREGAGIAVMLAEVGDAEPSVRRVMKDLRGIPVALWLVTHREVNTSQRVRVVADMLAEGLRRPPAEARAKAQPARSLKRARNSPGETPKRR